LQLPTWRVWTSPAETGGREVLGAASHDQLGSLAAQAGKTCKGAEMLSPLLGWFEEGFDTVDLKVARFSSIAAQ
jgi:hypothetical protein